MPDDSSLEVLSIDDVPLYNGDVEAEGMPDSITRLRGQIRASDGLLISTPEYNAGVPGVLKNTLDWISRPVEGEGSVFAGKPVALIGATPGGLGTVLAQASWLPTLRNLRLIYWTGGGHYTLSRAGSEFTDGELSAEKTEALRKFVTSFVEFAGEQRG